MIMYTYRLIGAVIIIFGLYLVVWGKSKDHKSTTTTTEDDEDENKISETSEEISEPAFAAKHNSSHQVININAPEQGTGLALNNLS